MGVYIKPIQPTVVKDRQIIRDIVAQICVFDTVKMQTEKRKRHSSNVFLH